MAKQAMRRVDVKKGRNGWSATTKSKNAAAKARESARPESLRIHGRDGRIQEERTYPRSADPRSSNG
jgi:hypothetical protein